MARAVPPPERRAEPQATLGGVGDQLRVCREARNLSAEAIAARSGTTAARLLDIEQGRGNPDFVTLDHIARLGLGLPLSRLIRAAERAAEARSRDA